MSTAVLSNTTTTNFHSSRSMSRPHSVCPPHSVRGSGVTSSNNSSTLPPQPRVFPGHASSVGRDPHPNDVLSGRGGRINSHPGNVRFRALVESSKRQYLDARTKKVDKARIAAGIVDAVRCLHPPGKFLREDPHTGLWVEIGDERAWKKAGQALRESAPVIRAERQDRLSRRAGAADAEAGAATTRGGGDVDGRRSAPADPPGPRHRPNPPAREGLAVPRRNRCDDRGGRRQEQQQPSAGAEDLELAQMRRECLQMQRLQVEQQQRMLQYQEQLLAAQQRQLQNRTHDNEEDPVYVEYQRMVQAQLTSQEQFQQQPQRYQNQENIAEAFDVLPLQGNSGDDNQPRPMNINHFDQYSHSAIQAAEGFSGQRFHSCGDDKTINTMSSFDVQSTMDLSSLGGFDFQQSQMSTLTSSNYNISGLMSMTSQRTRGSHRGGTANDRSKKERLRHRQRDGGNAPPAREAPPETLRQGDFVAAATTGGAQQPHPPSRRTSAISHGVHMMSSHHSLGCDAIEEDELYGNLRSSNFALSNLGMSNLSATDMTFSESMNGILSVRSNLKLAEKDADKENGEARRERASQSRGKAVGNGLAGAEQRLTAHNLAGAAEVPSGKPPSAASHNLSMEDFGESFKSMDMEDRGVPPSRPRPHGCSTIESLWISECTLNDLGASLESLRSFNDGSSWLNQYNSIETSGWGSGGGCGEEKEHAPRMVTATGGDA